MPFRGLNNEVEEGIKTKITLFDDRLEYKTKLTRAVTVVLKEDSEPIDDVDAKHYSDEEGVIDKNFINSFVKYIETIYDEEAKPCVVHYIDISYNGGSVTLSCQEEKDKHSTYEELVKWKYNIK